MMNSSFLISKTIIIISSATAICMIGIFIFYVYAYREINPQVTQIKQKTYSSQKNSIHSNRVENIIAQKIKEKTIRFFFVNICIQIFLLGCFILFVLFIMSRLSRSLKIINQSLSRHISMKEEDVIFPEIEEFIDKYNQMIFDEKRTKNRLTDLHARFFTLFEQIPLSIQLFSPDGYLRLGNRSFEKIFATNVDDLILAGYNIFHDHSLKESGKIELYYKGFKENYVSIPKRCYRIKKQGSKLKSQEFWLKEHIYPVKDNFGKIIEVVIIHEDVSHLKE